MFMNEVMSKILFSRTFAAQMMSLPALGLSGVIYFIIIMVSIGILLVVLFRALAVYIMAFVAISILIALAPLFLTFMLFEKTRMLFDNWVKFSFRYMIEPVVMLAGIIILTQLFTIYLDYVLGFSVCHKCAIPFRMPFPTIPGFSPAFLDVELFCINWFAPWGFDWRSNNMGMNMQHMAVLLILAYCLWGYIDFAGKMVAKLAGGGGGPSATRMGASMSNAVEDLALKASGLDKKTRDRIKAMTKQRISDMGKGGGSSMPSQEDRRDGKGDGATKEQNETSESSSSGSQSSEKLGEQSSNQTQVAGKKIKGEDKKEDSSGRKLDENQERNISKDNKDKLEEQRKQQELQERKIKEDLDKQNELQPNQSAKNQEHSERTDINYDDDITEAQEDKNDSYQGSLERKDYFDDLEKEEESQYKDDEEDDNDIKK